MRLLLVIVLSYAVVAHANFNDPVVTNGGLSGAGGSGVGGVGGGVADLIPTPMPRPIDTALTVVQGLGEDLRTNNIGGFQGGYGNDIGRGVRGGVIDGIGGGFRRDYGGYMGSGIRGDIGSGDRVGIENGANNGVSRLFGDVLQWGLGGARDAANAVLGRNRRNINLRRIRRYGYDYGMGGGRGYDYGNNRQMNRGYGNRGYYEGGGSTNNIYSHSRRDYSTVIQGHDSSGMGSSSNTAYNRYGNRGGGFLNSGASGFIRGFGNGGF